MRRYHATEGGPLQRVASAVVRLTAKEGVKDCGVWVDMTYMWFQLKLTEATEL